MKTREEFVLAALDATEPFSRLCEKFGVSRKTGYKWLKRYKASGIRGLEALSRKPDQSPLATSADVVAAVVGIRNAHPTWGPKKIRAVLQREGGPTKVPGTRTIARILERSGYIQPLRRPRRKRAPGAAPRLVVARPNDLWTVDFKGWWLSASSHERCEPLTIRDAFSRFLLDVRVLSTNTEQVTRPVFEDAFQRFGLPRTILTDNGTPFATSHGHLGLTRLSAWWLSLGIDVQHSRPATPSDNGAHERMHRDMKAELQKYAALTLTEQQKACDRWRHDFNHHRPHEALEMEVPAALYRRSAVTFDATRRPPSYPPSFLQRNVHSGGTVTWCNQRVFLSCALEGFTTGLEPLGNERFAVWFHARRLGVADFSGVPSFAPEPAQPAPSLATLATARKKTGSGKAVA